MTTFDSSTIRFSPTNARLYDLYSMLRLDWPVAQELLVRLNALIVSVTGGACIDEGALLKGFETAIEAYGQTLIHNGAQKHPDAVRIAVFTECLLSEAVKIVTSDTVRAARKNNGCDDSHIEQRLRQSIYELLVCDRLKQVFRNGDCETKILDAGPFVCG